MELPLNNKPGQCNETESRPPHPLRTVVMYPISASKDDDVDDSYSDDLEDFEICSVEDNCDDGPMAKTTLDTDMSMGIDTETTAMVAVAVAMMGSMDEQKDNTGQEENDENWVTFLELCKRDYQPVEVYIDTPLSVQVMLRNHHLAHPFAPCPGWLRFSASSPLPPLPGAPISTVSTTTIMDIDVRDTDFALFEKEYDEDGRKQDSGGAMDVHGFYSSSIRGRAAGEEGVNSEATQPTEGNAKGAPSLPSRVHTNHIEAEKAKVAAAVEQSPQPQGWDHTLPAIMTEGRSIPMLMDHCPCNEPAMAPASSLMSGTAKFQPSPEVVEQGLYVAYAALASMAVVPIYFGSLGSIKKWKNPNEKKKQKKDTHDSDDESSDEEDETETMSLEDAYMFPIFGSAVLFGLYLVFRFIDKSYVNYLITAYFSLLGVAAVTQVGVDIVNPLVKLTGIKVDRWHLNLTKKGKEFYSARFTIIHMIMAVVSVLLTGYYTLTKNWIASNIFGMSFALNAIQLLVLDSFKTGMILLSGLFVYDIFWVFGTEVMVSVAKNFDAPVKVIFPRLFFGLPAGEAYQFAMLGLGDIVIPGVFVALCVRFDQHLAGTKNPNLGRSKRFAKPYFTACFIAYIMGLATTMYVMHTFKAAQPALLYLSPACILSVLFTGAVRGELKQVFAYTSEDEEAKKKKEEEAKKKKLEDEKSSGPKRTLPTTVLREEPVVLKKSQEQDESNSASGSDEASEQETAQKQVRKRKGGKGNKKK
ncbi:hypothetical protein BGZ73_006082 [Actinomortierella ambigua]|nr:hypothetical protein BGZ73_006082 [Actinomortierella ambigua]